jgi:hypothetical protein
VTRRRFVPYEETRSIPNVIVDGARNEATTLTLSHWPKSGMPPGLEADTSTGIVFNYLDRPRFHVETGIVSNNHFDEDGLAGLFVLLQPEMAARHRDLLLDIAQAGDFGIFERREAARTVFALAACANADTSPLPADLFARPYPEQTAGLYVQLLEVLPRMLTNLDDFRALWAGEDGRLTAGEDQIAKELVTIEERPDLDLAIVRQPEDPALVDCHPFALHNRTLCTRLLLLRGRQVEFRYRYESWVQLASRRPTPRVDLAALADELDLEETSGGRWVFDGVGEITPRLHLEGSPATSIAPDAIVARVEHHLRTGPPAWNPYD